MRVMLTGHKGQLGQALLRLRPDAHGVDLPAVDITDSHAVAATVESLQPELIVHCAAWTAVDEAVRQPEQAYRVNALGTHALVKAAVRCNAVFAYISTNEVFDGTKTSPYVEEDRPNPINPYGVSKWAGETLVQQTLDRFFIIRTSWLTAPHGRNFAHRIQQLADEKGSLQVVTDEIASPTIIDDLAPAIWRLVQTQAFGVYHLVNQGHCSRFDFARQILDVSNRKHIPLVPITLAQYRRASTPPKFSALANVRAAELGIVLPPWQESLRRFMRKNTDPP